MRAVCAVLFAAPFLFASAAAEVEFYAVTEMGSMFQVTPPPAVPTSDVTMSPYLEFQRLGGLVASAAGVTEASQYNVVSGPTYIIGDWGIGEHLGVPTGAPLRGVMSLDPEPHLALRPVDINIAKPAYAVSAIEYMAGDLLITEKTDNTHGPYLEITGNGRALILLTDPGSDNSYMAHLACPGCDRITPAVIGTLASGSDALGRAAEPARGVGPAIATPCKYKGVQYGCGLFEDFSGQIGRPVHPTDKNEHRFHTITDAQILEIVAMDTTKCTAATKDNVEWYKLNKTHFHLEYRGCQITNYEYRWHDGIVEFTEWKPLRPGLNKWTPGAGNHAIAVDMNGGTAHLQVYEYLTTLPDPGYILFGNNDFTVSLGARPTADIAILYDADRHIAMYHLGSLGSTKNGLADRIRVIDPEIAPKTTTRLLGHSQHLAGGAFSGYGGDCLPGYKYCLAIFDSTRVPRIDNAQGAVYDSRNGIIMNRGGDVGNWRSVFGANEMNGGIYNDGTVLEVVQSYAVIPVSGVVGIAEIYLAWEDDCDLYIDDLTDKETWSPNGVLNKRYLDLKYLRGDYGAGSDEAIDIPMFNGYNTICLRQEGFNEFRQFNAGDMYTQGTTASFGGITHTFEKSSNPPRKTPFSPLSHEVVFDGNIPVTAFGSRTIDVDMDFKVSLMALGTARNAASGGCDSNMPRATMTNGVRVADLTLSIQKVERTGGNTQFVELISGGYSGFADWETLFVRENGDDCVWISRGTIDFPPRYATLPVALDDFDKLRAKVTATVGLLAAGHTTPHSVTETLRTEIYIERLSFRVY